MLSSLVSLLTHFPGGLEPFNHSHSFLSFFSWCENYVTGSIGCFILPLNRILIPVRDSLSIPIIRNCIAILHITLQPHIAGCCCWLVQYSAHLLHLSTCFFFILSAIHFHLLNFSSACWIMWESLEAAAAKLQKMKDIVEKYRAKMRKSKLTRSLRENQSIALERPLNLLDARSSLPLQYDGKCLYRYPPLCFFISLSSHKATNVNYAKMI